MAKKQFSNNASTTLATPLTTTSLTISVAAGGGAQFPSLAAGQNFTATLTQNTTSATPAQEVVLVTGSPAADTFTVLRAQEGTAALSWAAGDFFAQLVTAGDLDVMVQSDDLQAQAPNFAYDVGVANAYVVNLTPAITAPVVGMPIRVKIAHTNTGASTLNVSGLGAVALVMPSGAPLDAGLLVAGGMYTFEYDGSRYQATGLQVDVTGITQTIINLAYPVGAYFLIENDVVNPGTLFTWQQWVELNGVVLVGRDTTQGSFATTGQQGGEASHQLVANECPPLPYQDAYYAEGNAPSGGPANGNPQPGDQWLSLGGLNHATGSAATDYDNTGSYYRNATTSNGVAGPGGTTVAAFHNNLQPYRVVRMWRRVA